MSQSVMDPQTMVSNRSWSLVSVTVKRLVDTKTLLVSSAQLLATVLPVNKLYGVIGHYHYLSL